MSVVNAVFEVSLTIGSENVSDTFTKTGVELLFRGKIIFFCLR